MVDQIEVMWPQDSFLPMYLKNCTSLAQNNNLQLLRLFDYKWFVAYIIKEKVVLASNVGGLTEIIDNGCNGFLYDINNSVQLHKYLKHIIKNVNDMDGIKKSASEKVRKNFDIFKNSIEYKNFYTFQLK